LLRTINKFCLREVVNYRRSIAGAVAAACNPPDQVIPIGRCEGQDLHELFAGASWQFHQDKVRLHRLNRLLTVTIGPSLRRDRPEIFTVEEDLRIRHMVETVDLRLHFEQILWVADMPAQG